MGFPYDGKREGLFHAIAILELFVAIAPFLMAVEHAAATAEFGEVRSVAIRHAAV
jgi:hypothetical protein